LGEPEQLYLALETPLDGAALGLGRAVPRQETLRQPGLEIEDRASGGLGGVRGEDRPDVEREQGTRDLLGSMAGLTQAAQRPAHVLAQLCVLRPGYRRRKRNGRGDVGAGHGSDRVA